MKTIMAIGAHHDDNELVAGTLARHKQAGWKIVSVVMTDGKFIGGTFSSDNIPIRDEESRRAAALLPMETVFLRFSEGNLRAREEISEAVVRVIRTHAPEVIITHPPHDYHADHIATSEIVMDAIYRCWNPAVPDYSVPRVYYSDAWFVPFEPDEYVDVTEWFDLKLKMLRCHTSQLPKDPEQQGSMIELTRNQSRTRGIEAGVGYAEAFRFVPFLGKVRLAALL